MNQIEVLKKMFSVMTIFIQKTFKVYIIKGEKIDNNKKRKQNLQKKLKLLF